MAASISEKDEDILFPHFTVLKASAGSGKTHALTERFVQFILSDKIPRSNLRNILALTFSNNAAKEMRGRILAWLKEVCFEDPDKCDDLVRLLAIDRDILVHRAETLLEEILRNFTEFQVKTIDSFMTSIYKASAIDLGYSPDFDIHISSRAILSFAFNRYLREVRAGTPKARFLEKLLDLILENKGSEDTYLWDPSNVLLNEIENLYGHLSGTIKKIEIPEDAEDMESIKAEIYEKAKEIRDLIEKSGLQKSKQSAFDTLFEMIEKNHYPDLIGRGLKSLPVTRPKDSGKNSWYQRISEKWNEFGERIRKYTQIYAVRYYEPYFRVFETFKDILERVKKEQGVIFISDINKKLSDYLDHEIVPDVYLRIGETIYHFLIDEFQDTSPIQWDNLFPLIENSLSQGGSLFAVGDTKQAIYGFRNADYRIMRRLESENPFPSARHYVKELKVNYRSLDRILRFNEDFFQRVVAANEKYAEGARRSGLLDYEQNVKKGNEGLGHTEIFLCGRNDENPTEKIKLQSLIKKLAGKGYRYSDIAILTLKNEDVVNITTWLNEIDVHFISYSSLDIRMRKLTGEIVFLLTFLDSPPDDLAFAGFLLGEIFRRSLEWKGEWRGGYNVERGGKPFGLQTVHRFLFKNRKKTPLYKLFQEEFPGLWETYFDRLFKSTGYLPLYDLVSEIYRVFAVFETFQEEEATLVKILEVIKEFENQGTNNPGDFLRSASDEEKGKSDWNIHIPAGINAVQVMTIHKAKGLGFPVVILLLYEEISRGFKYIFQEESDRLRLLKINQKIAEASPLFKEVYEEERIKEIVNRLNALYVGFTRPRNELYIVGVHGERKQFPMDLLLGIECRNDSRIGLYRQEVHLEPETRDTPVLGHEEMLQSCLQLQHHRSQPKFSSVAADEALNIEEKKRGELIHKVLSFIDTIHENTESELEERVKQVILESQSDAPVEAMKRILFEFLTYDEIKTYFLPRSGRRIMREQEFSDSNGNLFRMDRLIIDEDSVTVMDYKTGNEKKAEANHILQIKNYIRILKDMYPSQKIEGIISYVDRREIVRVH